VLTSINGYTCDPEKGLIFGKRLKRPVGRVNGRGYVELTNGGFAGLAHRLIWESVSGPIPRGMQINHINGCKTDNRISNLEVVTPSENLSHAYRTGLATAKGESNGRAQLTGESVRFIRSSSESTPRIAELLGVSRRTVSDVRSGNTWRNIA